MGEYYYYIYNIISPHFSLPFAIVIYIIIYIFIFINLLLLCSCYIRVIAESGSRPKEIIAVFMSVFFTVYLKILVLSRLPPYFRISFLLFQIHIFFTLVQKWRKKPDNERSVGVAPLKYQESLVRMRLATFNTKILHMGSRSTLRSNLDHIRMERVLPPILGNVK